MANDREYISRNLDSFDVQSFGNISIKSKPSDKKDICEHKKVIEILKGTKYRCIKCKKEIQIEA